MDDIYLARLHYKATSCRLWSKGRYGGNSELLWRKLKAIGWQSIMTFYSNFGGFYEAFQQLWTFLVKTTEEVVVDMEATKTMEPFQSKLSDLFVTFGGGYR